MKIVRDAVFWQAFLLCWACTYLCASVFHTQMVLHELSKINVVIALEDRLFTTVYDLWGLLPAYGSAIAVALFIALLVTANLTQRFSRRPYLVPIAGSVAMLTMLLAMYPIMNITLIAGARNAIGLALQMIAGVFGGLAFTTWYSRRHKTKDA